MTTLEKINEAYALIEEMENKASYDIKPFILSYYEDKFISLKDHECLIEDAQESGYSRGHEDGYEEGYDACNEEENGGSKAEQRGYKRGYDDASAGVIPMPKEKKQ